MPGSVQRVDEDTDVGAEDEERRPPFPAGPEPRRHNGPASALVLQLLGEPYLSIIGYLRQSQNLRGR